MTYPRLETDRLLLRRPEEADFKPLSLMMQDEETTRFIGGVQTPALAWRGFAGILGHWELRGYGFFSVIEKASGDWVGRVGPWCPHLWPSPEIGWTITRSHWGRGYASEAAEACMDHVFNDLGWPSVIHLIDSENAGSQGVAARLGSRNTGERAEVPGFDIWTDIWGQSADDWRNRPR